MSNPRWQALGCCYLVAILAGCGGSNTGGRQVSSTQPPPAQAPTAYVYVLGSTPLTSSAESPTGTVFQYAIGPDNALQPLSVPTISAGASPGQIITDPSGLYVYVLGYGVETIPETVQPITISQFRVGATGQLVPMTPAELQIPLGYPAQVWLSADPQGQFLYAAVSPDYSSIFLEGDPTPPPPSIVQLAIGADGTLSVDVGEVTTVVYPYGPLVIDSTGSHAYVPGTTGGFSAIGQFAIRADGLLSPLQPAYVAIPGQIDEAFPGLTGAAVALSSNGQWAYVASSPCATSPCNPQQQLWQYTVNSDGTLGVAATPVVSFAALSIGAPIFAADGLSAYVLATGGTSPISGSNQTGEILQYALNSSGAFAPDSPPSIDLGANDSVSAVLRGNDFFVLIDNPITTCTFAQCSSTGAVVTHDVIQASGQLEATNTSAVAQGFTVLGMVVAPAN